MKTFVVIVIVLAIIYIIISDYWHITGSRKTIEPEVNEGERTVEEILDGRNIDLLYAELDAKELEDLTDNEHSVLYGITKWYEENPPPLKLMMMLKFLRGRLSTALYSPKLILSYLYIVQYPSSPFV